MKKFVYCPYCAGRLSGRRREGRIRAVCAECGWVKYLNPVPATACVVPRGDKVLLIKRGVPPHASEWALPGGFLELDESPEEGALRELREETGIEAKILRLAGVCRQPSSEYGAVLVTGYIAEMTGGRLKAGCDALEVGFFRPVIEDIPFESQRKLLRSAGF